MINKPFLPEQSYSTADLMLVKLCSAASSASSPLTNKEQACQSFAPGSSEATDNLAWWPDVSVLEELAADPNTPKVLLEKLAWHTTADVRAMVAENENAPADCILALAKDNDPNVRYQLAENHRLDLSVLRLLAADDHPYVACRAQRTITRLQAN